MREYCISPSHPTARSPHPWDLAVPIPPSPSPAASLECLGRRFCHDAPEQSQASGTSARLIHQQTSRKVFKTQPGGAGGRRGREGDRVPEKAFQERHVPGMLMVPASPRHCLQLGPCDSDARPRARLCHRCQRRRLGTGQPRQLGARVGTAAAIDVRVPRDEGGQVPGMLLMMEQFPCACLGRMETAPGLQLWRRDGMWCPWN